MTAAKRLVTFADIPTGQSRRDDVVSIAVRHILELTDGSQVLLLNDRGWGGSGSWNEVTTETVRANARMVVGPDEPPPGRSREEEEKNHWMYLQQIVERQGFTISAEVLRLLPHDVVISPELLARLRPGSDHHQGR